MTRLIENIRKSDAVERSMLEAGHFVDRALARLEPLHPGVERDALESLAKYIMDRRL
jgi:geranylgeranyl pyrophosphate synthase